MNTRFLPPLFVFVALAASGCPGGGSSLVPIKPVPLPTVPPGDYFPLAEGMQWKYEVVSAGARVQGTMIVTVTQVKKTGSDTAAEGIRTLQLRFSDTTTHGSEAKVSWSKTRTGVYESVVGDDEERQVLALPLKLGGNWTFGALAMAITSFDDMTINGKLYKNALKVRGEDGDRLGYATFAKDVGMVAWWGRKLPATADLPVGFGLLEHVKTGATPPPAPPGSASPLPIPADSPSPAASGSPTAAASPAPSSDPAASPAAAASPGPTPAPVTEGSPSAPPTAAPTIEPSRFPFS